MFYLKRGRGKLSVEVLIPIFRQNFEIDSKVLHIETSHPIINYKIIKFSTGVDILIFQ